VVRHTARNRKRTRPVSDEQRIDGAHIREAKADQTELVAIDSDAQIAMRVLMSDVREIGIRASAVWTKGIPIRQPA
jgi:hypothetical protein